MNHLPQDHSIIALPLSSGYTVPMTRSPVISSRIRFSTLTLLGVWIAVVHLRSLWIWFDWETVRFFVQPRPGRYRWFEVWYGSYVDLSDYGIRAASLTFRPLMATMLQFEALIWGGHVWLWHLVNLTIHLACVYLLIQCARHFGFDRFFAALTGLLFGVHPLVTQPMWIILDRAEQVVLLAGLIALLCHGRSVLFGSMALIVGLLSKETAITIPLWIVAWDLLVPREASSTHSPESRSGFWPIRIRQWAIYFGIVAFYVVYRAVLFKGMGGYRSVEHFRLHDVIVTAVQNLAWLLTVPHAFPGASVFLAFVLIAALYPKSPPAFRFGIFWNILFLIPLNNLCNKWYLYTPVAGMSLAVVALAAAAGSGRPILRRWLLCLMFLTAILFSLQSTAELKHQKRNADVPRMLADETVRLLPDLPKDVKIVYRLDAQSRKAPLLGQWFDPSVFQVKAHKSPIEAIVWDLNATRYLPNGQPIWTRSVEAALRYRYDSLRLTAALDADDRSPSHSRAFVLNYCPTCSPTLSEKKNADLVD